MDHSWKELYEIVSRLRGPDGCPWDREQTQASLRTALIEESHEVVEAIESGHDAHLCEELGDMLLLVFMHSRIAEERGAFCLADVAASACEKMIRRHPHVFGEAQASDSAAVLRQWEEIKRREKGAKSSVLDGVSRSLPALLRAQTVQKKVSRVGFDWPDVGGAMDKVEEEWNEIKEALGEGTASRVEEELGDFFFAMVNLTRKLGYEAETALAAATGKFIRRFQEMEYRLTLDGKDTKDLSLDELDRYWDAVKQDENISGREYLQKAAIAETKIVE